MFSCFLCTLFLCVSVYIIEVCSIMLVSKRCNLSQYTDDSFFWWILSVMSMFYCWCQSVNILSPWNLALTFSIFCGFVSLMFSNLYWILTFGFWVCINIYTYLIYVMIKKTFGCMYDIAS